MSSEQLADGVNPLDAELAATWDILKGYSGRNTDLGIARRFGGAAAAYSLRDIGAMNGRVVEVRRESDGASADFSANQVSSGALADFCSTPLTVGTAVNGTGSFNNYTFTANGNTGFDADNSGGGTGSAGFPYTFKNGDVMTVTYTVTNFSSTSGLSPQIRGTNSTSSVTSIASGGTTFTANGTYTDTLTASNDGTHLMFADANTGSYTISNFAVTEHKTNGFVSKWYDQSGNGRDMAQITTADQPRIVNSGTLETIGGKPTVRFLNVGTNLGSTFLETTVSVIPAGETSLCYLTVASTSTTSINRQTFNGAGTDFCLGSSNAVRLRYNGSADTFTSSTLSMSVDTNHLCIASVNSSKVCTLHLDDSSETDTSAFSADASSLNQFLGENSSSASSDALGLQGTMSEIILYLGDKTNDISDLQNDINNFYNI